MIARQTIFPASSDAAETSPVAMLPAEPSHTNTGEWDGKAAGGVTITLPFELTNGNDGRGSKWFSSAKIRTKFEKQLRQLGMVREPFSVPVTVTVTRILGPKQALWDSSSIGRGNWKEIEDALVACGWFHDDGPKYITRTNYEQDASRRCEGPGIEIEIELNDKVDLQDTAAQDSASKSNSPAVSC